MDGVKVQTVEAKLERSTRKWWFFLIFIVIQFIPSYTSKTADVADIGIITGEILSRGIVYSLSVIYPVFKIVPILLLILIVLLKNRVTRIFAGYVALTYVLFAFLQNIAITEKWGLGILTINLAMFLTVAAFWIWETIAGKNDFTPQRRPLWRYWVVPVALLAFWYPANGTTFAADFNPVSIVTNMAGLTFCMMTPVYLAVLTIYHPRVNIPVLRVTALVGLIIAFYNVWVNFFMFPGDMWWNGVLHVPLTIISIYAFILSFVRVRKG